MIIAEHKLKSRNLEGIQKIILYTLVTTPLIDFILFLMLNKREDL
jgi:hypothetical protein